MEAVKKDGWNFKYASEELRGDREFVLELMKHKLELMKHKEDVLIHISEELLDDREFVSEAYSIMNEGRENTRIETKSETSDSKSDDKKIGPKDNKEKIR